LRELEIPNAQSLCAAPYWTNQQIKRIAEECGLIAFDSHVLQIEVSSGDEYPKRPRQLKKNTGSEITINGMPTLCDSLLSGCRCLAL